MFNITCSGDGGYSSLLLIDSGEYYKKVSINNFKIYNSSSNGPLIKIIGIDNEISIDNSEFQNIISYGSMIDYSSYKVLIYLILI